jgi:hypothetical protein
MISESWVLSCTAGGGITGIRPPPTAATGGGAVACMETRGAERAGWPGGEKGVAHTCRRIECGLCFGRQ